VYYQAGKSMTDNAGDLALTGYTGTNLNSLAVRANESSFTGDLNVSKEITTKAIAMDSPANTPPNTLLKDTTTIIRNAGIEGTPGQYFMIRNFGTTHSNNANMQMAWNYGGSAKLRYRIQNANTKNWTDWGTIYSEINKPTPAEIGAIPSTGGTVNGNLNLTGSYQLGGVTVFRTNGASSIISCKKGYMYLRPNGDSSTEGEAIIRTDGVLQVAGGLQVAGTPVVQSGSNANGQWVKYYDGTLVCSLVRGFGNSPFQTKTAEACWTGPDTRKDYTFPHAFVSAPSVQANASSTGYLCASASGITATAFTMKVYSNYSSVQDGCVAYYVAIGRWK